MLRETELNYQACDPSFELQISSIYCFCFAVFCNICGFCNIGCVPVKKVPHDFMFSLYLLLQCWMESGMQKNVLRWAFFCLTKHLIFWLSSNTLSEWYLLWCQKWWLMGEMGHWETLRSVSIFNEISIDIGLVPPYSNWIASPGLFSEDFCFSGNRQMQR